MIPAETDKQTWIEILNKILEAELAGVVRYTHYLLMVYGFGRIPIIKWLRQQADEGLRHAQEAGELITHLGVQFLGGVVVDIPVPEYRFLPLMLRR